MVAVLHFNDKLCDRFIPLAVGYFEGAIEQTDAGVGVGHVHAGGGVAVTKAPAVGGDAAIAVAGSRPIEGNRQRSRPFGLGRR
jgi:hypothetical protein